MRKEKDYYIILYDKCYCGIVNKTKQPISKTFCNCSRGYLKDFFEGVFEKEIQLEIIDTVIHGANNCTFRLIIPNEKKQNVLQIAGEQQES
jgi:predicted hydrocarbon binding protein